MMHSPSLARIVVLIGLIALLSASDCAAQKNSDGDGATTAPAPPSAGAETVDDPNTVSADDAPTTGSEIRMLKMEKLRSQMFNPGTSSASPTTDTASDATTTAVVRRSLKSVSDAAAAVAPPAHQQIAMLREGSRERMQQQLARLFEDTRRAQLARWRAKQQQQQYENATAE
jgi:hypothetical protein